jgi:diaminohydroxyphosphoribosylaminopyrimidine deaminase/5-amino-6-(5-phosphoribosylamino)uracil reductase
LSALGVDLASCACGSDGQIDMAAMLRELARRGVTRVLVEGGARVHASFLSGGLADRLEVFTGPIVLGGDARGAAAAIGLSDISSAPRFERIGRRTIGSDLLETFARKA